MNSFKSLTVILAFVWITVKLSFYFGGVSTEYLRHGITLNFGFLLFIVYSALKNDYDMEDKSSDWLADFRVALKEATKYVAIIFLFLLVYYTLIHKTAKEELAVSWKTEQIEALGGYENYLSEVIDANNANPANESMLTREMYPESQKEHLEEFRVNIKKQVPNLIFTSVILLGLFFLACTISAIGAALFKFIFQRG